MVETAAFFGFILKILYLIPFIVFYLLAKRINSVYKTSSYKWIKCGLILNVITTIYIYLLNIIAVIGYFDRLLLENVFYFQAIGNLMFISSFIVLFVGMLKIDKNNKLRNDFFPNLLLFLFFLGTITLINTASFGQFLSLILYPIAIYFLIITLFVSINVLCNIGSKMSVLPLIGIVLLVFDPIIYMHIYINVLNDPSTPLTELRSYYENVSNPFYFWRNIEYIIGTAGMMLVLIPHATFLINLLKKHAIVYTTGDTAIVKVIKSLSIDLQRILGKEVMTMFGFACNKFKSIYNKRVIYNKSLDIKGLNALDEKRLLSILIAKYYELLGKPVIDKFLDNIRNKNNEGLINDVSAEANELYLRGIVRTHFGQFLKGSK